MRTERIKILFEEIIIPRKGFYEMAKIRGKNNRDLNKDKSKLLQTIDDSAIYGEDYYESTQIVTNYYYKPNK